MSELKPCPFCGGEAEVVYTEWCAMYTVRCMDEYYNCEAMPETRHFVIEREAIEAWNRRVGEGEKDEH